MEMPESIKNVVVGKKYDWGSHLSDMVKINCERCQEFRGSIHFPILFIWIAMTTIPPISEVAFTSNTILAMRQCICFIPKGKLIGPLRF